MDPYLEDPQEWPEVHNRLIVNLADWLSPQLRPTYRVAIEKRTYQTDVDDFLLVGLPDVTVWQPKSSTPSSQPPRYSTAGTLASTKDRPFAVTMPMPTTVKEGYLEIRRVKTGEVVTAIEILSPSNKRPGEGRDAYIRKRRQVLGSSTHLVEIDLLRTGEKMPAIGEVPPTDYRILVSRGDRRPNAMVYAFTLREAIPVFPLPLRPQDPEPLVDLQTLLNNLYDLAGYDSSDRLSLIAGSLTFRSRCSMGRCAVARTRTAVVGQVGQSDFCSVYDRAIINQLID